MPKKYKVTLTEKQMSILVSALNEYMRLRMGQDMDFVNDIAFMEADMSPDNPKHKEIFNAAIQRRDSIHEIMKAVFNIAFQPYGVPREKSDDAMIAECMWDAVRTAIGMNHWGKAMPIGEEPLPEIEVID